MTSQSGRPPDQVICRSVTHSYQLVSQISSDKSPQSFAKSKLICMNGDHMKDNDYIYFDHESFKSKNTHGHR